MSHFEGGAARERRSSSHLELWAESAADDVVADVVAESASEPGKVSWGGAGVLEYLLISSCAAHPAKKGSMRLTSIRIADGSAVRVLVQFPTGSSIVDTGAAIIRLTHPFERRVVRAGFSRAGDGPTGPRGVDTPSSPLGNLVRRASDPALGPALDGVLAARVFQNLVGSRLARPDANLGSAVPLATSI